MKYIYCLLVALLTTSIYSFTLPPTISKGVIRAEYTLEIVNIIDGHPIELKTIGNAIIYSAAGDDPRLLIEFSELESYSNIRSTDKKPIKKKEKRTYYYDGQVWKDFLYKTEYSDGFKSNDNEVIISKKVPMSLDTLEEYYNLRCLMLDSFYYFPYTKITILDALTKQVNFPKINIKKEAESILITSKTATNNISAKLSLFNDIPILSQYTNIYMNEDTNSEVFRVNVDFAGRINLLGTSIFIPNRIERTSLKNQKDGFRMTITIHDIKYLPNFDFKANAPIVPMKWRIVDMDKNIQYINSESKEAILQSTRSL